MAVTTAPLTVNATSQAITAGSAIPPLTYTYTGLVGGDTTASFTGALATSATSASPAGTYTIIQNTLLATGNYSIGLYNGANVVISGSGGGGSSGGGGGGSVPAPIVPIPTPPAPPVPPVDVQPPYFAPTLSSYINSVISIPPNTVPAANPTAPTTIALENISPVNTVISQQAALTPDLGQQAPSASSSPSANQLVFSASNDTRSNASQGVSGGVATSNVINDLGYIAMIPFSEDSIKTMNNLGIGYADLVQFYQMGTEAITLAMNQDFTNIKLFASLTSGNEEDSEDDELNITFQKLNNRRVSNARYGYEKRFLSDPEFRLENGINDSNLAAAELLMEKVAMMA